MTRRISPAGTPALLSPAGTPALLSPAGTPALRSPAGTPALLILLFAGTAFAAGQPVTLGSTLDQNVVGINQTVEVTVNVTTRGVSIGHIELPKSDSLQLVGNSQSEESSFSMGPGGIDSSHTTTYHLTYRPSKTGDFTLSPVRVTAGGHSYQGSELQVRIVPAGQAPARQQQRQLDPFGSFFGRGGLPGFSTGPQSSQGPQSEPDDQDQDPFAQLFGNGRQPSGEDVILGAVVDRQRVVLGQQVTYTIRLYTRTDVSEFSELKLPGFDGFWGEDLETPSRPVPRLQTLGGVPYQVYLIKKKALFPDRAGTIDIGAAGIDVSVGLGFFRGRKVHRDSTAIALDVQPLPAGAPPGFSPTNVGQWRFTASLSPAAVPVGEPATLSMVVEGQGNVHGLTLPTLPVIPGLRAYDPTSTDKLQPQGDRLGGRRQVDIILIPQRTGDFDLPPLKFQWYDPKVGYQEASAPPMVLHASVGTVAAGSGASAQGGQNVLEATYRGLRSTDSLARACGEAGRAFIGPLKGAPLAVGFTAPPVFLLGAVLARRWQERRLRDAPALRGRRAYRVARQRLRSAGDPASPAGAAETAQALFGYLEDRLGEPMAGLSHGDLRARLLGLGVELKAVDATLSALELAESLRYQPALSPQGREVEKLRAMAEFALAALERSSLKATKAREKEKAA